MCSRDAQGSLFAYIIVATLMLLVFQGCSPAAPSDFDSDIASEENVDANNEGVSGALPIGTILQTTANLNFRAGPSNGQRVIRVLPKGTEVRTVEFTNPTNSYYKISHDGEEGWSHGGYLRVVGYESPWVMINAPQEGATARNPVAITYSAGGGVTHVSIEADGAPLHDALVDAQVGTYSHSFTELGQEHLLKLTGFDTDGVEVATFEVVFTPVEAGQGLVFPIDLNRPGLTLSHFDSSSSTASFGSSRSGGRRHAGCDLYWTDDGGYAYQSSYHSLNDNTPIYAVADGTIVDYSAFYQGTNELVVDHGDFVIRYGEVDDGGLPGGLTVGSTVTAGQMIAKMGDLQMSSGSWSMLHFEVYSGQRSGALTNTSNWSYLHVPDANYQRRADLMDCRTFLADIMP